MWVLFSILNAFSESSQTILSKKIIIKQSKLIGMWSWVFFASILAGIYTLLSGFTVTDPIFYYYLFARIAIDSVGIWTLYTALAKGEASVVVSLTALTPIFTIVIAFLYNDQVPTMISLFGVLLISFAAYLVVRADKKNVKIDNKDLNSAVILMLISIFLWSVVANIHVRALQYSNPATYFFLSYLGFAFIFTLLALLRERHQLTNTLKNRKNLVGNISNGTLGGMARIFSLNAVLTGPVGYVSAIKTSNIFITAFLSSIFLKENFGKTKILGVILVVIGTLLIILGG
jgi:drug/metabolite transporter (DMT)-like permease